eukprot:m.25379 g.25379  ORF g.25379 m.25379 type:complete len:357 (+) comp28797_c0_seq3:123-1193(+)
MFFGKNPCSGVFPSAAGALIFVVYTVLCVNHGILITLSRGKDGSYSYNITTVVIVVEFTKLVAAVCLYVKSASFEKLFTQIKEHRNLGLLYFVPAFLYCLYNNLAFINLANYDPTTYFVLLQFRVVIMGFVYQCLFRKRLSTIQWFSIILLSSGCIVKELGFRRNKSSNAESNESSPLKFEVNISLVLILVQTFCSCFAAVYNEYLLKGKAETDKKEESAPLMVQNVFMYLNSILCNFLFLLAKGELVNSLQWNSIKSVGQPNVVAIIVNSAAVGIVTSVFLKSLNSILKSFANATEILLTAIISYFLFSSALDWFTALAVLLVMSSLVVYNYNPIQNKEVTVQTETKDKENAPVV